MTREFVVFVKEESCRYGWAIVDAVDSDSASTRAYYLDKSEWNFGETAWAELEFEEMGVIPYDDNAKRDIQKGWILGRKHEWYEDPQEFDGWYGRKG